MQDDLLSLETVPDRTAGALKDSVQASVVAFAAESKSLLEYELLAESVRNCEYYSTAFVSHLSRPKTLVNT